MENSAQSEQVRVELALGAAGQKLVTPIVCQLCEMDWQHGACGDCTLTRQQLEACEEMQRRLMGLETTVKTLLHDIVTHDPKNGQILMSRLMWMQIDALNRMTSP